jgi:N-acetylglucosamine kinase-like BadF-type ATPase
MILIADSGSTKTLWCLLDHQGKEHRFETIGFNPYFSDQDQIVHALQSAMLPDVNPAEVQQIYFYGAGCFPDKIQIIEQAMHAFFVHARVQVELDLLGAARSALGNSDGFIAILGTGANSGLFRHGQIVQNIDSLGYILGDEGSGCYLGKKLLTSYLRGFLPLELSTLFVETYRLSVPDIMDALYAKPNANRFCASFSVFLHAHVEHPYVRNLVEESFDDFFTNLVSQYPDYQQMSFNCVGSVGYHFKQILELTCQKFNMQFGSVNKSPMEGLAAYHAKTSKN